MDGDKVEVRTEKSRKMYALSSSMRELEWCKDLLQCNGDAQQK